VAGRGTGRHRVGPARLRCGDRNGEARVRYNLGVTAIYQHDYASAARRFRAAIAASVDAGRSPGSPASPGTARRREGLASAGTGPGAPGSQAEEHLWRALALFRDTKDQAGEATALSGTGELSLLRGQFTEATRCFGQSLAIYRSIGHRTGVASQLHNLGVGWPKGPAMSTR
jgi:tetratricopeptide (TPR) repeat protein